jgi:hypothetical protein
VLTEARQWLPDGRERERGLPLSEKLLAGEGWREGAVRAVAEELGSALADGWHEQVRGRTISSRVPAAQSGILGVRRD